jgi:alkanesulfonate monooxygenase SsuD/methylene tetrahydromethanopterin reductase-like flavin-dependent oxidoreductase (luciferase family)
MLGLCGEIAQGLLMVFSTLGSARTATEHLSAGTVRAGRKVKEIEIASLVPASVARDRKTAYDRVRPVLGFYLGYFPRYQRVAREAGFGAAVDMIADASRRGDSERTHAAIPDEMVAELTASGTAADLRARIAEYRRSGIALPILMPVQSGTDSMVAVVETLRAGAG